LSEDISPPILLTNLRVIMQALTDAASGVFTMHARDVIHRDIAARNFLWTDMNRVVLADLGRAVDLQGRDTYQAKPEPLPIRWSAPESLLHHTYSKASDVYAFGVFMYEVFARELPFKDKTLIEVAMGVVDQEAPLKLATPGCYPMELRGLLQACMDVYPAKRPTIREVTVKLSTYTTEVKSAESVLSIFSASGPRPPAPAPLASSSSGDTTGTTDRPQSKSVLATALSRVTGNGGNGEKVNGADEHVQYQPYRHLDANVKHGKDDVGLQVRSN